MTETQKPKRKSLTERIAAMKLREADKLIAKVRRLRADAITLEAEADRLLAEAEVKP